MNRTQYITIHTVLDYEIEQNKNSAVLEQIVTILVDNGEWNVNSKSDKFYKEACLNSTGKLTKENITIGA